MTEAAYAASRNEIFVDEDMFITAMLARHWVTLLSLPFARRDGSWRRAGAARASSRQQRKRPGF